MSQILLLITKVITNYVYAILYSRSGLTRPVGRASWLGLREEFETAFFESRFGEKAGKHLSMLALL